MVGVMAKKKLGADLTTEVVNRFNEYCDREILQRGPAADAALQVFMLLPLTIRQKAANGDWAWLSLWLARAEQEVKEVGESKGADGGRHPSTKSGQKGKAS